MLGAHSDTLLLTHVIWATAGRTPTLTLEVDDWLGDFLAHGCRAIGCDLMAAGNSSDHVHVVLRQPPSIARAEAVGRLKGGSSHAWNVRSPNRRLRWQTSNARILICDRCEEARFSGLETLSVPRALARGSILRRLLSA